MARRAAFESLDEWIDRTSTGEKVAIDFSVAVQLCQSEAGVVVAVEGPSLAGGRTTIIEICKAHGDFAFGWTGDSVCLGVIRCPRPLLFARYHSAMSRFAPRVEIANSADAVIFTADCQKARADGANYWALELAAMAHAIHGRRLPFELLREVEPWGAEDEDSKLWEQAVACYPDARAAVPMLVQLNKSDVSSAWPVPKVLAAMGLHEDIPHIATVASEGIGLDQLLEFALSMHEGRDQ